MLRSLRRRLWPLFDLALSVFGGYASREVGDDGYVGSVEMTLEEVEELLDGAGFEFEVVAALKHRSCPRGAEVSAGSWVLRESWLTRQQLHVHLFSGRDDRYTDVYAHYEPSWIRSPVEHYRSNRLEFEVGGEVVWELLEEAGVEPLQRSRGERCRM